jgi:PAS domain S-box-containing protein
MPHFSLWTLAVVLIPSLGTLLLSFKLRDARVLVVFATLVIALLRRVVITSVEHGEPNMFTDAPDWVVPALDVGIAVMSIVSIATIYRVILHEHDQRSRMQLANDERMRRITEYAPVGFLTTDTSLAVSFTNGTLPRLLNMEDSIEEGSPIQDALPSPIGEAVLGLIEECQDAPFAAREVRFTGRDVRPTWLRVSIGRMQTPEGRQEGFLLAISDVTSARQQMVVQEGRAVVLQQLSLGAPLEDALTALCRHVEETNHELRCSILLKQDDHLRHGAAPSLPDEYNEAVDGFPIGPTSGCCGVTAHTGLPTIVDDLQNHPNTAGFKDMLERFDLVACWSYPIHDSQGQVLGTIALYWSQPTTPSEEDREFVRTVAHLASIAIERHHTAKRLERTETLMSAALQGSPAGVIIVDAKTGKLRFVNDAVKTICGTDIIVGDQVDGYRRAHNVKLFDEAGMEIPEDELPVQAALREGRVIRNRLIQIERPDGDRRWTLADAAPVRDAMGEVIASVVVFPDITALKHAEEERERLLHQREARREELESIFRAANHDLRSPLVNLDGFGRELELGLDALVSALEQVGVPERGRDAVEGIIDSDLRPSLRHIRSATQKLEGLVRGLKRLSSAGRSDPEREPIDMNELVAEQISGLQFQITRQRGHVEVSNLPGCLGDAGQIGQIISNLLDNALKYTDPRRKPHISVTGIRAGNEATYSVSDNGIGIAPEHRDGIFGAFRRLHPNGPVKGEGLGLTIMNGIVEAHGGRISVDGKRDQGTVFRITLPAAATAPVQVPELT